MNAKYKEFTVSYLPTSYLKISRNCSHFNQTATQRDLSEITYSTGAEQSL